MLSDRKLKPYKKEKHKFIHVGPLVRKEEIVCLRMTGCADAESIISCREQGKGALQWAAAFNVQRHKDRPVTRCHFITCEVNFFFFYCATFMSQYFIYPLMH